MKAEDIYRLWLEAKKQPTQWQRIYAFARACEQHGIERTVAALQATVADSYTDHLVRLTRESVAAELKKETDK